MSVITPNPLATGFGPPTPDFALPGGAANLFGTPLPQAGDNIAATLQPFAGGEGTPPGAAAGGNFSGIFGQLMSAIATMFANLGSMLGGLPQSPPSYPAPPYPETPVPLAPRDPGQTYFTNATANSTGDPHETFDGTTGTGATIDQKWDSMRSHPDLLNSNSFAGGYRVSTTATAPNAQGITLNKSATVTAQGGNATVTMNADGSYSVSCNGKPVTLQQGVAEQLGGGESVVLNADGSLTVNDANAQGGTIATTLRSNGNGGVDVLNTAHDVDLGGSLVGHAEYLSDGSVLPPRVTPVPGMVPLAGATPSQWQFGDVPNDVQLP